MTGEERRFREAFKITLDAGVKPTPTLLNRAMGRKAGCRNLPGRLSKVRRQLLAEAGFRQTVTGRADDGRPIAWSRWKR